MPSSDRFQFQNVRNAAVPGCRLSSWSQVLCAHGQRLVQALLPSKRKLCRCAMSRRSELQQKDSLRFQFFAGGIREAGDVLSRRLQV